MGSDEHPSISLASGLFRDAPCEMCGQEPTAFRLEVPSADYTLILHFCAQHEAAARHMHDRFAPRPPPRPDCLRG